MTFVAYCKTESKDNYLVEKVTISSGMAPIKEGYMLLDLLRTGNIQAGHGTNGGGSATNNYIYNKITGECTNGEYYAVYVKL